MLDGYVEVHHIVPKCLGGTDDRDNLVQLTAEEHFVAHQLLHKIHPNVSGLAFAMVNMTGNPYGYRSNKLYGWIRRKASVAARENMERHLANPAYREKWLQGMEKLRADPERHAKMRAALSKANKGRVKSERERRNIAEAGKRRSPRKFSEKAKKNMAEARRKVWAERRANGTDKLIAQKTRQTRINNGSYEFTDQHKANIAAGNRRRFASATSIERVHG